MSKSVFKSQDKKGVGYLINAVLNICTGIMFVHNI